MAVFSGRKIKMSNTLMAKLYQLRRKLTSDQSKGYPLWLNDALIQATFFVDLVLSKTFNLPATAALYVIVLPILFMMDTITNSKIASHSILENIKKIIKSTKEKAGNNKKTLKTPLTLVKNSLLYLYAMAGITTVIILGGITNWIVIPYKEYIIPVILELFSISNLLLFNAPLYAVNAFQFIKEQFYCLLAKKKSPNSVVINQSQQKEQAAQAILAEIKFNTPIIKPTCQKIEIPDTELPSPCSTSRGSSPKADSPLPSETSQSNDQNVNQFQEITEPYNPRITKLFDFYNLQQTPDSLAHLFRTMAGKNDTVMLDLIMTQDKSVIDKVNTNSGKKLTALHLAILKNNVNAISFLIKAGASTNIQDATGKTALDLLKESTNSELVNLFKDLQIGVQPLIVSEQPSIITPRSH